MLLDRVRSWGAPAFLILCLLLGGTSGTAAGVIANALLQSLALCLLLLCLWTWGRAPAPVAAKGPMWLTGFLLLLCLLSLIPLPPALWQQLPAREPVAAGLSMLGLGTVPLPLSLAPEGTLASLLCLLPPSAVFLLVLRSSHEERKRLPLAVLGVAVVSIFLGAAQLLGGGDSPLRFYQITSPNTPVGFFSNTNHYATLILCALPFIGYLTARVEARRSRQKRSGALIVLVAMGLFLVTGVAISGSLAGYGLAIVTIAATLLVYRRATHGRLTKRWIAALALLLTAFLAAAWVGPLNTEAIVRKVSDQPGSRKVMTATTLAAAKQFFPAGSGLGSFPDVYRTYETKSVATGTYVNHAHNDYAELLLELGAGGFVLVLGFLAWWIRWTLRIWRGEGEGSNLGRAASIIVGVILLHSLVDYPLRTSAIAALFAMACALLAPPSLDARKSKVADRGRDAGSKHLAAD